MGTTRARLATGHEKTNAINFRIKILLSSMRQIYRSYIEQQESGWLIYLLALSVQDPSSESEETNREK